MTEVSQNDPIKITTPNGHIVTLRPFVPPRLRQKTRAVFLRYGSMDYKKAQQENAKGKKAKDIDVNDMTDFKDGIPAEVINEINDITLQIMVISIDEVPKEETFDFIMDNIREADYDVIVKKCNEISELTTLNEDTKKK